MRWVKRDLWKLVIFITGLLLFLAFTVLIPATLVGARGETSGLAPVATVRTSPSVNVTATMNALQEDKLRQEIQQLQYQNEQTKNQNSPNLFVWVSAWLRTNVAIFLSTLVVVIGALIGLFRWFGDRRSEREKRAEERFQAVVVGLGSKDIEAKVGSAIMLRTFLQRGYKRFYRQVFDLSVAHLRLRKTNYAQSEQISISNISIINASGKPLLQEPNLPIDSLSQALISAFKLSYPLARKQLEKTMIKALIVRPHLALQYSLFLLLKRPKESFLYPGLRTYWIPQELDATNIQLDDANLYGADLAEAKLPRVSLQRVSLFFADLSKASFRNADLSGSDIEEAKALKGTDLHGVKGLTKEQLEICKAKGAIIDEATSDNSTQPPTSPTPQTQQ